MSVQTCKQALIAILDDGGFPNTVYEFGYDRLGSGLEAKEVIVRFAGMESDDIDGYGPTRLRVWLFSIELYAMLDTSEDTHNRLMEMIDTAVMIVETKPHLGLGDDSSVRDVEVIGIDGITEVENEEGTVTNLRSAIAIRIEDEKAIAETE